MEKHLIAIQGHFFIRGVDIAVVNTFLLYRRIHESKSITLKDYNRKLAVTYFKKGYSRSVVKGRTTSFIPTSRANVPDGVRLIGEGHILEKRTNQRRCQYPSCKSRLLTSCKKCNVTLCVTCFAKFHHRNVFRLQ